MLYKEYPPGGGLLFRRYFGMGTGIMVEREEMSGLMADCDISTWTAEATYASAGALHSGQVVEANQQGLGTWITATVTGVRADGTVDVQYFDDEVEFAVGPDYVRARDQGKLGEDAPTRQRRQLARRERLDGEEAARQARAAERLAADEREQRIARGRQAAAARVAPPALATRTVGYP
jgi:hypothetical protein